MTRSAARDVGSPRPAGRAHTWLLAGGLSALLGVVALWFLARDAPRETEREASAVLAAHTVTRRDLEPADARSFAAELPPSAPQAVQPLDDGAAVTSIEDADSLRLPCVLQRWASRGDGAGARPPCDLVAVDLQDRPVPNAVVEVWGAPGRDAITLIARLATDALGRVHVSPPASAPMVRIYLPGTGCSGFVKLDYLVASDEAPRLVLVPLLPEIRVEGVVEQFDGQREPGIPVMTARSSLDETPPHAPRTVMTDAQGRFALDVHEADDVVLIAGEGDALSDWVNVNRARRRGGPLVLRLPGHFVVTGHVRDAAGGFVDSTLVSFVPESAWTENRLMANGVQMRGAASDMTDWSGEFEITVPFPGRGWLVLGSAHDFLDAPVPLTLDAEHAVTQLDLTTSAVASIAGRVVDSSGAALAGVRVRARPVSVASRPPDLPAAIHDADLMREAEAVTAADGRFSVGPLHPRGVYDLLCTSGKGATRAELLRPAVAAGRQDVELAMRESHVGDATIRLAVTARATGLPVSPYTVTVRLRSPRASTVESEAGATEDEHVVADANGIFRLAWLRAGDLFDLNVSADDFADGAVLSVPAARDDKAVTLALDERGGLSLDASLDGKPAPWVRLTLTPLDPPIAHGRGRLRQTTRADADGHAAFEHLPPGRWRIDARSGERKALREIDVPPGSTAHETLELR